MTQFMVNTWQTNFDRMEEIKKMFLAFQTQLMEEKEVEEQRRNEDEENYVTEIQIFLKIHIKRF